MNSRCGFVPFTEGNQAIVGRKQTPNNTVGFPSFRITFEGGAGYRQPMQGKKTIRLIDPPDLFSNQGGPMDRAA